MSPEFTYITKAAAKREKDIIDNQVLAKVVDSEKLRQMHSTMKKPEVIETQTKRIDIKKKDDFQTQTGQTHEQESFAKRSQSEVQIANQIKNKNKIIKYQKEQQKQKNKPKVKTLTQSSSNSSSTGSKGFANVITLSLIVSFVCGALFMIVYMIIKG